MRMLASYPDMPLDRLISAEYPIEEGVAAFERGKRPDALKVLINIAGDG